ncbi:4-hydroxy-2-oxovalerate aldolase [Marinomonas pontica]|uniref:4-hydroxy-2-oxovalerate aldolase n=1 Tax=Marinomonas pontica TaxID=264739 RepID=UPI002243C352|nr:4-hydroxy-2-oxovalerate aldolase [Marinomonas pontica]MCW8354483.1 4-hydroxy-2-oxovalerate aldolase [Marinomonas pontica]
MSQDNHILISDPTLRDGNHAVSHQLTAKQIALYCSAADRAGIPIVEVGHGNGLGASSLQVGLAAIDDFTMLTTARDNLKSSKLAVHVIPGFATIEKDIKPAIEYGVDVFRVAAHCTEADVTERHIHFCRNEGKTVFGVLMMTHMADRFLLAEEATKMQAYGAEAVILMDSAGNYLPSDVVEKVSHLVETLSIPVGFHAHNNLGMAIANSIAAVECGALILDGCARGFGAGAGNTQLEALIAVLERMKYSTGVDLYKTLDAGNLAERELMKVIPTISSTSIVSGLSGVFSGFLKPVNRISQEFGVNPRDVFFELGRRKVVAGQEDIIIEVAKSLKGSKYDE